MKTFLLFSLFITPLISFSQKNELIIKGEIKNINEPIPYVYVVYLDGEKSEDSCKVVNGKYHFRNSVNVSSLITLLAKNPNQPDAYDDKYMVVFYTEPAVVNVTSVGSFSNFKVVGYNAYLDDERLRSKLDTRFKFRSSLYELRNDRERGGDTVGALKIQSRIDSVTKKIGEVYYRFALNNSKSYYAVDALNWYVHSLPDAPSDVEVERIRKVYNKLRATEKGSSLGRSIKKNLESFNIKVGMMAPLFTQKDTTGNEVALSGFRGRYVLLDFWASWCGPCRRENPNLVRVYEKYKTKGFTVLSVSLDKEADRNKWIAAINKDGLNWTHVSDLRFSKNEAALLYKINGIPQNFLIDPSGRIIAKSLFGENLNKKLSEVLK